MSFNVEQVSNSTFVHEQSREIKAKKQEKHAFFGIKIPNLTAFIDVALLYRNPTSPPKQKGTPGGCPCALVET